MNSKFILAYALLVNTLKSNFLLHLQEVVATFCFLRGVVEKTKLIGLAQEGGIYRIIKFPTGILLGKDSYRLRGAGSF